MMDIAPKSKRRFVEETKRKMVRMWLRKVTLVGAVATKRPGYMYGSR